MINPSTVVDSFVRQYCGGREGIRLFRAPGRVNIIGEHTDYNDGFVLPVAIDRDTVIAARMRSDTTINLYSVNKNEGDTFDLNVSRDIKPHYWVNYIEGVARILKQNGNDLKGADLVLSSDVPTGGGLSSSAALEMSSGFTLLSLANIPVDRKELALAGQRAEHEYVGANVGIMDQFISAMGEVNTALLIDCLALTATPVPVDTRNNVIMVCNTGVKHDLATSAYNDRRRECEEAVEMLRKVLPEIKALRDVSLEEFDEHQDVLPPLQCKRARHVVTENARTLLAANAIANGDFDLLATLLYESHRSLRFDYEVSAKELDVLVDLTRSIPGVFGSRMTGGGFGGCTISFVDRNHTIDFSRRMTEGYKRATGLDLEIYQIEIANGVEEILA